MVSANVGNEFCRYAFPGVYFQYDEMQITINNQSYIFDENSSLENAVESLALKETNGIALALNEEIIPKSDWSKTILNEEDKIIIIGAVAGG